MSVESRALGLDPYDALRGTRVPAFIRRNRRARQVVIQLRKRSRLNLAPLLGVKPFVMAKTLGSFAAADARRMSCGDDSARPDVFARALLGRDDIARAGDGAWGYEFDVQTRWAFYASGSPNIIASVFCARGLAEAGLVTGEKSWVDQLHATAGYLERELLTGDGWLRYTPQSDKLVHNANLLGAAVLAASGGLRGHRMGVDAAVVQP